MRRIAVVHDADDRAGTHLTAHGEMGSDEA